MSPWRTDLQQIFQGVVWNAVLFPVSKIFPGFDSTKKRKLVLTIIKHEEIEVLIFLNSYKERKGWKKVDMWWSVRLEKEQHVKLFLMFKISLLYFYQYPIKINWVVSCNRVLFDENRTWKTINILNMLDEYTERDLDVIAKKKRRKTWTKNISSSHQHCVPKFRLQCQKKIL